jgi:hypothetical protein
MPFRLTLLSAHARIQLMGCALLVNAAARFAYDFWKSRDAEFMQ